MSSLAAHLLYERGQPSSLSNILPSKITARLSPSAASVSAAASARTGEDIDYQTPVERIRKRLVQRRGRTGLDAIHARTRYGAPRLIELDRDAPHPDRKTDASVPAHRQTNFPLRYQRAFDEVPANGVLVLP
jgi:hypothetical protein